MSTAVWLQTFNLSIWIFISASNLRVQATHSLMEGQTVILSVHINFVLLWELTYCLSLLCEECASVKL